MYAAKPLFWPGANFQEISFLYSSFSHPLLQCAASSVRRGVQQANSSSQRDAMEAIKQQWHEEQSIARQKVLTHDAVDWSCNPAGTRAPLRYVAGLDISFLNPTVDSDSRGCIQQNSLTTELDNVDGPARRCLEAANSTSTHAPSLQHAIPGPLGPLVARENNDSESLPQTSTGSDCSDVPFGGRQPTAAPPAGSTSRSSCPETAVAGLVVLELPSLGVVYSDVEVVQLSVPYIPGYLAFREVPAYEKLLDRVRDTPHCPQV